MDCSMPGFPIHDRLPEKTNSCPLSQWCHPTISSTVICLIPPSIIPNIGVFSNESILHIRGHWSFSFSISPSVNIQDWFPLGLTGWIYLMSKGLKSLVQHHSSKTSIWHSGFFLVQLSHAYMTMRKTKALTRCIFVCKVMSLPFNMLYRLFIIFSSKEQASFNFMATVTICSDFGAPQNKVSHCFPIYFPWSDGTRCHGLSFWMLSFKPSFFTLLFYIHQEAL